MQNTDPVEISDIATATEISSEEMSEIKGGGGGRNSYQKVTTETDTTTSNGGGSKNSGITTDRVSQ